MAGPAAPRRSQRERLIDAIVELSGQLGYPSLSIAQISTRAGVSSATFYEQFADREECLLDAYRTVTARTLARMQGALEAGEWAQAARPAFTQLLQSVQADPDAGRLMFVEVLGGGPRVRREMRLVLDGMEQRAEELLDAAPAGGVTLDIPGRALIGAVRHVVARHLRTHEEDRLPRLTDDILAWMGAYAVPAGSGRWSTGPDALLGRDAAVAPAPAPAPPEPVRLPRGRHGLPPGVVARNQRARILDATATVTMEHGYANTTVADIVAAAGVAKEAFYRHFADKEEAFLAAQDRPSQYILDALVAAYFAGEGWPARLWGALELLLRMVAENPVVSHLRLVECYTAGPAAIRRAEDITRSFTIFLEEGFRLRAQHGEVPRLFTQAVAAGMFEIVQCDVADGQAAHLPRRLPQLAYIAMAPFLGPDTAIAEVRALASRTAG